MTAPPSPDLIEALAAYDVEGEIGRGSWGVVLKARHRQLGREVAVKQLPLEFSARPDVRRRFVNEARLLASLDHPHIVPIYDYIEKEGVCLVIMEYLPGGTVWSRFNSEGFDYADSVAIALATSAALHFAHRHGVLHRDIKPENLMFSGSGILKVTDFGIAKVLGAASTMGTRAGEVLGSPAYIAPEQATGGELGPYTDVYATAVVLYELLSGRLPFPDDGDPLMVMYRHVHESPEPLQKVAPEVPEAIARVVMYGLSTKKEERYQTAEDFGVALAEAATSSFGTGWLSRCSVQVIGGGPIIAATERTSVSLEGIVPKVSPAGEKLISESGLPALATPAGTPAPQVSGGGQPVVAPAVEAPENKTLASASIAGALVLMALAILLAFLGPSKSAPAPSGPEGLSVSIQGTPVTNEPVTVDFDRPVDVRMKMPPGAPREIPQASKLLASVSLPGGITVPVRSQLSVKDGDVNVFVFEGRQFKYLVAGKTTVHFKVEEATSASPNEGGRLNPGYSVQMKPANKNLFAIPTMAASLILLAVFAYAEALIVPMRRGKKRVGPVIGLGVLGLIAGVALVVLGWALGGVDPRELLTGLEVFFFGAAGAAVGLWAYFSPPKRPAYPTPSASPTPGA